MKARAHAALIKAWADGADIESRYGDEIGRASCRERVSSPV